MKRASSLFNIFNIENDVEESLKNILQNVESVKKACKAASKAFKDTLQIKKLSTSVEMAQETIYFKSGELVMKKANMIKHQHSPVRDVLLETGNALKTFASMQSDFELKINQILDCGKINELIVKEYLQVENEKSELSRKIHQHINSKNQYEKEQKKLDSAKDDPEYEKELKARVEKAEVDISQIDKEYSTTKALKSLVHSDIQRLSKELFYRMTWMLFMLR